MIKLAKANKLLTVILLLAFFLRFIGLIPNIDHPDEGFVQIKSWDLVKNIVTQGDFDPHTFKYGTLFFYLQTLVYFPVLYVTYFLSNANILISSSFSSPGLDFNEFHEEAIRKFADTLTLVGRAEVALFGLFSIFILYLIGQKLFNKNIGLLAAFFFAISPLHVRDSHYITTDVPSLFTFLLALYFFVLLWQEKRWKWFILSGLTLGVSATIRFFPVAALAYPVAILFSFQKQKTWVLKVLLSMLFIFMGIFLGLPFLFLKSGGINLFMQDLEKYSLPWYSTGLTTYLFSLASYLASSGQTILPHISLLIPTFFKPFYASYVFFFGIGPLGAILAILGLGLTLILSIRKFIILSLIPLSTFIYISSYVPANYERLIIPVIPFLSLFAGVFIYYLFIKLKEKLNYQIAKRLLIVLLILVFFQPFLISASSTYGCAQEKTQSMSAKWVDKNIPDSAKIAYITPISVPSNRHFAGYYGLEPNRDISLEEVRSINFSHAFINGNRLDYITYTYFVDSFIPEPVVYKNSYYPLVLAEYSSRASLLGNLQKSLMCDSNRIFYYELPKDLPRQKNQLKNFGFDNIQELSFWKVQNFNKSDQSNTFFNPSVGRFKEGSLKFQPTSFKNTPPRLHSDKILIKGGQTYTFSAWLKSQESSSTPSAILRMDFYNPKPQDLNTFLTKLSAAFQKKLLYLWEGSTASYFEKERSLQSIYDDVSLPGEVVALSPRTKLGKEWQKISITAKAPGDASFAILSIQGVSGEPVTLYLDDIDLLGP